jgi:hypothetical protein
MFFLFCNSGKVFGTDGTGIMKVKHQLAVTNAWFEKTHMTNKTKKDYFDRIIRANLKSEVTGQIDVHMHADQRKSRSKTGVVLRFTIEIRSLAMLPFYTVRACLA